MTNEHHTISIVIPTFNRLDQLGNCLEAMAKTEFPTDRLELIIVDDGSPIDPDESIRRFRERFPVRLVRKENGGPASARNAGAAVATGRFIAFTDDDCRPAPDWLTHLHARLAEAPTSMIGGHTVNALTSNSFSATSQLILEVVYRFFNADGKNARFFASNNIAMATERFHDLGGFDVTFRRAAAEDRDFCDRWIHRGLQLIYEPRAVVCHFHSLNLGTFWKQHFNYGRGAYHYHQLRAQRQSGRMRDDTRMHFRLPSLLREPLSAFSLLQRCRIVPLLCLWQFANAAGFCWEKLSVGEVAKRSASANA